MPKDKLQSVHDAMVEWCLGALSARDKETGVALLTAAEASVIRAFLKDNDITATPAPGSAIDELRKKLAEKTRTTPINPALDGLGDGLLQ